MNQIDDQELQGNLKEVKASLAVEGLYLTGKEEELVLMRYRNEISQEEFLRRAKFLAKKASKGGI